MKTANLWLGIANIALAVFFYFFRGQSPFCGLLSGFVCLVFYFIPDRRA